MKSHETFTVYINEIFESTISLYHDMIKGAYDLDESTDYINNMPEDLRIINQIKFMEINDSQSVNERVFNIQKFRKLFMSGALMYLGMDLINDLEKLEKKNIPYVINITNNLGMIIPISSCELSW